MDVTGTRVTGAHAAATMTVTSAQVRCVVLAVAEPEVLLIHLLLNLTQKCATTQITALEIVQVTDAAGTEPGRAHVDHSIGKTSTQKRCVAVAVAEALQRYTTKWRQKLQTLVLLSG